MKNRERILATLHGHEVDRFPVWLKMANRTWQNPQPEPYRGMGPVELLQAVGSDIMLTTGLAPGTLKTKRPHITETVTAKNNVRRTTWTTPDGDLHGEMSFDPFSESWHPTKFPADTLRKFKNLRWYFTDTEYSVDPDSASETAARQRTYERDDIFTAHGVGPSPLMELVEHLCGPEACMYHHFDDPERFDEVMALMHEDRLRFLKATLPYVRADTYWLTENTSTSLISPSLFEQYCMPHLTAYGNMILEHGLIPVHHMCGSLNALLEMIDGLPAVANEAYTTRPLGDVSLAEGRLRMPSKTLIGGTNATLWLEEPERIAQTVAEDLRACPDRRKIFLTSAGVLPPPVSFEKAKTVIEALKRL